MTVTTDRTQAAKKRTRPFVVISSDTHVGQSTFADFTSYIDPSFREDYKIWADAQGTNQFAMTDASRKGHDNQTEAKGKSANAELRRRFVEGFSKGVDEPDPVRRAFKILMLAQGNNPDVVDEWAGHYSTDTVNGGGDSAKRLQLLEKQGVVGEVSLPGGAIAGVAPAARPAMANFRGDEDVEFIWVQMQAYNRWLRDFSDAAPGRRATPIMVNLNDLEAAIAELRWARNAGMFGGVLLPQMSIASGLPGYADPYYEPLWSACEDLDAPLNLHVGVDPNDAALYGSDMQVVQRLNGYEMFYLSRRP